MKLPHCCEIFIQSCRRIPLTTLFEFKCGNTNRQLYHSCRIEYGTPVVLISLLTHPNYSSGCLWCNFIISYRTQEYLEKKDRDWNNTLPLHQICYHLQYVPWTAPRKRYHTKCHCKNRSPVQKLILNLEPRGEYQNNAEKRIIQLQGSCSGGTILDILLLVYAQISYAGK